MVSPGELQPLLHSTSDTQLRRRVVASHSADMTSIDMEGVADCDTDSNKTEVEEIEMIDMEGREVVEEFSEEHLAAARHRLETRQEWTGDAEQRQGETDENGNPTTGRHIHPIMTNNVRPVSIYRHTPVFRPQKLTVPHTVHNNASSGYGATNTSSLPSVTNGLSSHQDTVKAGDNSKRRTKKKKNDEEKNVVKAEDIEGYRGNKDIDSLLEFLGEGEDSKKKSKKTGDKQSTNTKKVSKPSDSSKEPDQKTQRKKKEKSAEKESQKPGVTKKLSIETVDTDAEDSDKRAVSEETEHSLRQSISPEKVKFCS